MTDSRSSDTAPDDEHAPGADANDRADDRSAGTDAADREVDPELRAHVEEEYDFNAFGPDDMARMSLDEWEAAFDPDTWITGEELLDRVEQELKHRVSIRDVFAVVERVDDEDGPPRVLAYSDRDYAIVYPDGSVEGRGTVLRDVKPTVALCSMVEYDPPEPPADGWELPRPEEVPEGTGSLGGRMLQLIAGMLALSGLFMIGASVVGASAAPAITLLVGLLFLGGSLLLLLIVVNARLSDRFRADEYRGRLRAIGIEDGERPDFVPIGGEAERDKAGDGGKEGGPDRAGEEGGDGPRTGADVR